MTINRVLYRVLSENQKVVLALSKSVSATLSLIASSIIIYKIYLRYKSHSKSPVVSSGSLRSLKNDEITTYHRMLLSISILDVVHSLSSAFNSLLVPSYTKGTFAHGTIATCSIQGALQQLTPSIVIYMAMLNTYFMLKIRYNVSDSVINNRYEVWLHAIPIMHFLTTAITGLSLGLFGPIILPEMGCWLDTFCAYTNTCTRSGPIFYENVDYFAWSFAYIWLFLCVLLVTINAILIYTAIRSQEKRNEKYLGARLQKEATSLGSGSLPEFNRSSTSKTTSSSGTGEFNKSGTRPSQSSELNENKNLEGTQSSARNQRQEYEENAIYESIMFSVPPSHTNVDDVPVRSTTKHARAKNAIKQSRIAAVQSLLYVCSALLTAVWVFMPWVGNKLQVKTSWRFFFAFMVNIVSPSQGIFNLFVFVRLHYLRLRETNKEWGRLKCAKECMFSSD